MGIATKCNMQHATPSGAVRARKDPAGFGFVDVSTPCNVLPTCEGHLFWDGVHPTTQAHARLGDAALQVLFQQ